MIFVDANIPMYIIGDEDRHKLDAQHAIERLTGEGRRLITSSEVFQDILHRYMSIGRREAIEPAFDLLRGIVDDVLAVEEADVFAAKELVHAHAGISARDALHVAVMRRNGITEIVSFDRGFDPISGIRRLPAPQAHS